MSSNTESAVGTKDKGSNVKLKISKKKKKSKMADVGKKLEKIDEKVDEIGTDADVSGAGIEAVKSESGTVAGMEVTSAHGLLLAFLEKHRYKDGDGVSSTGADGSKMKVTHTSMGKPFGSFCIPDKELHLFHKLVTAVLKEGKVYPHLVERHSEVAPMIIDFDFRFDSSMKKRQYTEEHVQKIVDAYMSEIRKMFKMSPEEEEEKLVAFVFQRDGPYAWKKIIKDGLHIVFPFIVSRPEIQFIIREAILKQMPTVLADLAKNLRNGWGDVVDRAVIEKTGWMMYGSTKPKCEPYQLTYVYDSEGDAVDIKENYDVNGMVDLFSIRNKSSGVTAIREERKEDIDKYLSRKTAHKKLAKKKVKKMEYDLEMIKKYVSCLNSDRADDQRKWMEVGWCLYNIDNGSEMLKLWVAFSKKSSKFEAGACEKYWMSGAASKYAGITIGSLKYWASIDDPDAYKEIKANDLNELIDKSADGTHNSVAKVMKALYEDSFASVIDSKTVTWYMYDGNMWRQSPQAIDLVKKMSNDLVDMYCGRVNFLNDAMGADDLDEESCNNMVTKTSKLCDLINNLGKTPFKNNVLKECQEEFHNPDFKELLDANLYLLGMENGIYDLKNFEFRAGRPDDYVSLSAGASFMEYDEEDDTIQEVYSFLEKIYVDEELRHFVLKFLASTLDGYLAEEAFYILVGSGCHAKGEKIMMADGKYKLVEDVVVGEQLMGDDSKPKTVKQLFRGKDKMYEITPKKGNSFVVNQNHILTLKSTNTFSYSYSDKEHRFKCHWMALVNGIPTNMVKNFPVKYTERKVYYKKVTYYDTKDDAIEAIEAFKIELYKSGNCLKKGDVFDIKLSDYVKYNKKFNGEKNFYLFFNELVFEEKQTEIDPYFLGCWLGDGSSNTVSITTMDEEIANYTKNYAVENGLSVRTAEKPDNKAKTYHISTCSKVGGYRRNTILNKFKDANLIKNKHIPDDYKCNSKNVRLQILAGLIDTDGNYQAHCKQYTIIQKNEKLIDDICYVAKSLGFACYKSPIKCSCVMKGEKFVGDYFRVNISGEGIEQIPVKLERKKFKTVRTKAKDVKCVSFKFKELDNDDYYGFELDGNGRYVFGEDQLVTHNSNGKSLLNELVCKTLGEYVEKLPISILTQKRSGAENASPMLMSAKNKRWVYLDEPDAASDHTFNSGALKEYTGGDRLKGREMFKEPDTFMPQFTLGMLCNDIPKAPPTDDGAFRRFRVIPHDSKFIDNLSKPRSDHPIELQFKKDTTLKKKLDEWVDAFMAILIHYYKIYRKEGLKDKPEAVMRAKNEYQESCDAYAMFVNDFLEKADDERVVISNSDLERCFRSWFEENYDGEKVPNRTVLKAYLKKRLGPKHVVPRGIRGYVLKGELDEDKIEEEDSDVEDEFKVGV